MSDPFAQFKAVQREGWSLFLPLEMFTTIPAAKLVSFARIAPTDTVLDVGCGTGVVAVTAARLGAKVQGLDLAATLLGRAKENASIAQVPVEFTEGDAEALPFTDASFNVVVSQFGHMFAPRPAVAIAEMLRVLKPGGASRSPRGRRSSTSASSSPSWGATCPRPQRAHPRRRHRPSGATPTSCANGSAAP
jgi:ubiquinone/menaquinone biosynthesis C-methylase UbiE